MPKAMPYENTHDAIRFDTAFEHAVYTRDKLVKTLNK